MSRTEKVTMWLQIAAVLAIGVMTAILVTVPQRLYVQGCPGAERCVVLDWERK